MRFNFTQLSKPDLPLVRKWLVQPHVAKWLNDENEWMKEISANLESNWVWHFRADLNLKPAGFVQCYDTYRAPEGPWSSQPPATFGIDFFLGESSLLGKGNGVKLVNEFVQFVKMRFNPKRLIVDPDIENKTSQRTIKRYGFKLEEESGLFVKELKKASIKTNSADARTSCG